MSIIKWLMVKLLLMSMFMLLVAIVMMVLAALISDTIPDNRIMYDLAMYAGGTW